MVSVPKFPKLPPKLLAIVLGVAAILATALAVYIWMKWIPRRDLTITGSLSGRVTLYVFRDAKPDMTRDEVETAFGLTGRITTDEDENERSETWEYGVQGGTLKFHFPLDGYGGGAVEYIPNYLGVKSFFKGELPCELPAYQNDESETCVIDIYRHEKLLMQVRCMGARVTRVIWFNE